MEAAEKDVAEHDDEEELFEDWAPRRVRATAVRQSALSSYFLHPNPVRESVAGPPGVRGWLSEGKPPRREGWGAAHRGWAEARGQRDLTTMRGEGLLLRSETTRRLELL